MRAHEYGFVDRVVRDRTGDGYRFMKMRVRTFR